MGKEEETHQTMTQTTDEKSNEVVSTCTALSIDDVSLTGDSAVREVSLRCSDKVR